MLQDHFTKVKKMEIDMKYIGISQMIALEFYPWYN